MGNEQSLPSSRESPEEGDDEFDLDKIQGDDEITPPTSPALRSRQTKAAQTPLVNQDSQKRKKPPGPQAEAHNQFKAPASNRNKTRKAWKKSKGSRAAQPSSELQPVEQTRPMVRATSPENHHVYATASSEVSEDEQPAQRSPVRAGSPKAVVKKAERADSTRKARDLKNKSHVDLLPRIAAKNPGRQAQFEQKKLRSKPELDGSPVTLKQRMVKKEDSPEITSMVSEVGYPASNVDEAPRQDVDNSLPAHAEDTIVMAPREGGRTSLGPEHTGLAQQVAQTDSGNIQLPASDMVLSMNDVPMQDAQIGTSDQHPSSPSTVFDAAGSPAPANNLPSLNKTGLKRKRDDLNDGRKNARSEKERRGGTFSPSPATSVEAPADASRRKDPKRKRRKVAGTSSEETTRLALDKVSGLQPTLGSWAKALSADSTLRYPIFNPASPKRNLSRTAADSMKQSASGTGPSEPSLQVVIPTPSRGRPKETAEMSTTGVAALAAIRSAQVTASTKGKERAKSDARYYSLAQEESHQSGGSSDSGEVVEAEGFATTIARRTPPHQPWKSKRNVARSRTGVGGSSSYVEDPDSDEVSSPHESDIEEEDGNDGGSDSDSSVSAEGWNYRCERCQQKFKTELNLKKHLDRPRIHARLHKCLKCSKEFHSASALKSHQQKTSHGVGDTNTRTTGHLSYREIRKVNNWRDGFCNDHDIDEAKFNDMMTASKRKRGSGSDQWSYEFITKRDFLDQYLQVLPKRDRRSMLRYRERNFTNSDSSNGWKDEDDDELEGLVKELGTKWVEIGERMTRTSDSVSQRWRHKLQHRRKRRDGIWTVEEFELLRKAVATVKGRLGVSADQASDRRVAWQVVSDEIGNIRTAQQCSNHWDWLRREHQYSRRPRQTKKSITPKRKRGRPSAKAAISNERVDESDEMEEPQRDSALEESSTEADLRPHSEEVYTITKSQRGGKGTPRLPRNPLETHSPGEPMTLTQAFGQTRANTSALRESLRGTDSHRRAVLEVPDSQDMPDRPSPTIPVKPRPDDARKLAASEDTSDSEDEEEETSSDPTGDEPRDGEESSSDQDGPVDEEAESDNDTEVKLEASQEFKGVAHAEEEETSSDGSSSDSATMEDGVKAEPAGEATSEDETTASGSDDGSSSGSTSASASDSDEDSMVDDTKKDFVANVQALAKKRRNFPTRPAARMAVESSDSDSE